MADRGRTRKPRRRDAETTPREAARTASTVDTSQEEAAERALAVNFARGIPVAGVAGALVVGQTSGLGPAILVLAGTALFGTIGFFWASLRTLSGEAPLPEGVAAHAFWRRAPAPERKREALRALKDLEFEHSIGKIDDADYKDLSARYRDAAKAVMREMDEGLSPRREQAEALVKDYLTKNEAALTAKEDDDEDDAVPSSPNEPESLASPRLACVKCGVSNEPDAAFCKKCGTSLAREVASTTEKVDASV